MKMASLEWCTLAHLISVLGTDLGMEIRNDCRLSNAEGPSERGSSGKSANLCIS